MGKMSRENDGLLKAQYLHEIRDAFSQCGASSSQSRIDYEALHDQLTRLMESAYFDGLREREFLDLVRSELPEAWERLRFLTVVGAKKSA